MNTASLTRISRVTGAVLLLRAVFYAWQSFVAFHSLFGSLAENVFFVFFFALLALCLLLAAGRIVLRPLQSIGVLSVAVSAVAVEPLLFFSFDWSYGVAAAAWFVCFALLSVLLARSFHTARWTTHPIV